MPWDLQRLNLDTAADMAAMTLTLSGPSRADLMGDALDAALALVPDLLRAVRATPAWNAYQAAIANEALCLDQAHDQLDRLLDRHLTAALPAAYERALAAEQTASAKFLVTAHEALCTLALARATKRLVSHDVQTLRSRLVIELDAETPEEGQANGPCDAGSAGAASAGCPGAVVG